MNSQCSQYRSQTGNNQFQQYADHQWYQSTKCKIDCHFQRNLQKANQQQPIRFNNNLIKAYTDVIYDQYKINNPFQRTDSQYANNGKFRDKVMSQSLKKCIKLTKKSSLKKNQIQIKQFFPPSKINQLRTNAFLSTSKKIKNKKSQNTDLTPVKIHFQLKKSNQLKSTAKTHFRSKTGLAGYLSKSPIQQSQILQIEKSQTQIFSNCRQGNPKLTQEHPHYNISITQFQVPQSMENKSLKTSKRSRKKNDKPSSIHSLTAKNSRILNNFQINSLHKVTIHQTQNHELVLCPICQQKIKRQLIDKHEQQCNQLRKLYKFDKNQLVLYIDWKIRQHFNRAGLILINPNQLKQSTQFQESTELQTCSGQNEINSGFFNNCSKVQGFTEQFNKILWFQVMKEKLLKRHCD